VAPKGIAMSKLKDGTYKCNFCHKSNDDVGQMLVEKDGAAICDECVELCYNILSGKQKPIKVDLNDAEKEG
jgi:ATP-dependent protease Clp ATPase subunit